MRDRASVWAAATRPHPFVACATRDGAASPARARSNAPWAVLGEASAELASASATRASSGTIAGGMVAM